MPRYEELAYSRRWNSCIQVRDAVISYNGIQGFKGMNIEFLLQAYNYPT